MPIPRLLPKQPDPKITKPRDQELAKFGHLNWLIDQLNANPAGGVLNVTASAPLSSTGGAIPNIAITQAGVASAGFLSAADFNYFASKMNPLGYVPENINNKVDNFSVINSILYPTTNAVNNQILQYLAGLDWKEQARVATTANIALTGIQTIDGVLLVAGNRVLVKNQTLPADNGVYIVSAGAWTRSTDTNTGPLLEQMAITVTEGTANANLSFVQTTSPITLGVSAVNYSPFGTSVPLATSVVNGILKLYTTTGSNTDGTMDQNSITAALATKLSAMTTDNVTWVSKGGFDAGPTIGLLERLDRPFASILAAKAAILAASPSDLPHTIAILPGTYTEIAPIDLDDGINYEFFGTGTLSVSSGNWTFRCTSNSTVTLNAPGWSFVATGNRGFLDAGLYTTVNLHITIKETLCEFGDSVELACDTSSIWFKADTVSGSDSSILFSGGSGFNGSNFYCNVENAFQGGVDGAIFSVGSGNFYVRIKSSYAPLGFCIFAGPSNPGCQMMWDMERVVCGGGDWPVWLTGQSTHMAYRGLELIGASDCIFVAQSSASGITYASIEKIHSNYVGTQDGIVHAEGTTMYLNNATITRAASAVNGGDIKTSASQPHLFLKDVSFDITRQRITNQGECKTWNGTDYVNICRVLNNPAGSGNTITGSSLNECIVNFASLTGKSVSNVWSIGSTTLTFNAGITSFADEGYISGRRIVTMVDVTWNTLMGLRLGLGSMEPGTLYHVTTAPDNSTIVKEAWLMAVSPTELDPIGFGTFITPSIVAGFGRCQLWFNYNNTAGNILYRVVTNYNCDITGFGTAAVVYIDRWLQAVGTTQDIIVESCTINAGPWGTIIEGSRFIGQASNVILPSGTTFGGTLHSPILGGGANIFLKGTQSIINVVIEGVEVDCTAFSMNSAYTQSGVIATLGQSTFVVTPTDNPKANPDGFGTLDINDFPWAGIIQPNSAANDLFVISPAFAAPYSSRLLRDLTIAPTVDGFKIHNISIFMPDPLVTLNGSSFQSITFWTPPGAGPGTVAMRYGAGATGASGYSGYSGYSGKSGYSGISGWSGANPGASGYSGWSGANPGPSGYSGYSGATGVSLWVNQQAANIDFAFVTVNASTTTLVIEDGTTAVDIGMASGLSDGQYLIILFILGSPNVTWSGAPVNNPPSTVGAGGKLLYVWNNTNGSWY